MLTHVKPAVTLIIALLKQSHEKKKKKKKRTTESNVGSAERGATSMRVDPQNGYYINCT